MTRQRTRILLTRHGQTVANVEGRFCGHSETRLTPLGEAQARALGARLAAVAIDACYTSDLSRAVETARLALGERAIAPVRRADLRERHYGQWEMEREDDVRRRDPVRFAQMEAEDPAWQPPGGESTAGVRARTFAALQDIAAAHAGETVLVVGHGTALNCMLSMVLGMPETHVFRFDVRHCALFEVEAGDGPLTVVRMNDAAHLDGLA
ncbi:histidine phosphatase family protein [Tepidiforma flava]|uniref:phosphoglycerate mutase (2,3-diphosphoglycerate-dependent) n=1 Tax=Tepidiforma flava TaxID=3004094 RepID=A0ABY7M2K9_9CHLR|nr:histidine phosphatase family protein [Tepidiforma flava]WBL34910.1 histidine phosphatase family protein [Tepidiforma flava]